MDFDENFLYVTSFPNFTINGKNHRVEGIQKKSNCIFVLNKTKYDVLRTIKFEDWLGPEGLFLDKFFNILTVIDKLNIDKTLGERRLYIKNLKLQGSVQLVEFDKHEELLVYNDDDEEEDSEEDEGDDDEDYDENYDDDEEDEDYDEDDDDNEENEDVDEDDDDEDDDDDDDDDDFITESYFINEKTFIICYKRVIGVYRLN